VVPRVRAVCDTTSTQTGVTCVSKASSTGTLLGPELAVGVHDLTTRSYAVGALATVRLLGHHGLMQQRAVHRLREDVVTYLDGSDDLSCHIFRI
jgi:hypothetical protein